MLIYLLLADRDVEIVADRGVQRSRAAEWEAICREMETDFRAAASRRARSRDARRASCSRATSRRAARAAPSSRIAGRPVRLGGPLGIALGVVAAIASMARGAPTLIALTESGALLVFPADHPDAVTKVLVHGLDGALVGIDLQPADQRVYGLTTTNEIYTIDPKSGEAKLLSSLTVPFDGGTRWESISIPRPIDCGSAFERRRTEPARRRRRWCHRGQSVNHAVSAAIRTPASAGDFRLGLTHSLPGTATTKLFNLDTAHDLLTVQDQPNDRAGDRRPARRRLRPTGRVARS